MSIVKYVKGTKAEGDKIALIKGHAVSYPEIAELVVHACNTEDLLYPPSSGKMGATYFMLYIAEAMMSRQVPCREKFRFPKKDCHE